MLALEPSLPMLPLFALPPCCSGVVAALLAAAGRLGTQEAEAAEAVWAAVGAAGGSPLVALLTLDTNTQLGAGGGRCAGRPPFLLSRVLQPGECCVGAGGPPWARLFLRARPRRRPRPSPLPKPPSRTPRPPPGSPPWAAPWRPLCCACRRGRAGSGPTRRARCRLPSCSTWLATPAAAACSRPTWRCAVFVGGCIGRGCLRLWKPARGVPGPRPPDLLAFALCGNKAPWPLPAVPAAQALPCAPLAPTPAALSAPAHPLPPRARRAPAARPRSGARCCRAWAAAGARWRWAAQAATLWRSATRWR